MTWNVILKQIDYDKGTVSCEGESGIMEIPLKYLPKHCRKGDVFRVRFQFNPFKTLEHIENTQE